MMMTRRYCLTIKKDTKRERCKEEQIPRVVTNIMTRPLVGGAILYCIGYEMGVSDGYYLTPKTEDNLTRG